jgi:hypothetical protein
MSTLTVNLGLVANAGGTVNAITASFTPAIISLTDGIKVWVRSSGLNTITGVTFSPNGLTAKPLVARGGSVLREGDTGASKYLMSICYNLSADKWEILNPATSVLQEAMDYTDLAVVAAIDQEIIDRDAAISSAVSAKENSANKSTSTGDSASNVKFPVWSAVVSYVTGLGYQTASAVNALITSALATFKTTNFLDATSSIQTQFNSIAGGNVSYPRRSNAWYSSATVSFMPGSTVLGRDVVRLTPFIVSETTSFNQMAMEVSSAGSVGSVVRMGVYSSISNYPSTNLLNAGTIAGDSVSNQIINLASNLVLTPGLYWLAYIHNSTTNISFRTIPLTSGSIPNILGLQAGNYNTNTLNIVQMPHTYDGTFPTISGSTTAGLNVAIVSIKTV